MDVACDVVHPGLEKLLTWSVGRGPVPAPATAQPAYDTQRGPGLITPRPSSLVASVVGARSFLALLLSASS